MYYWNKHVYSQFEMHMCDLYYALSIQLGDTLSV